MDKLLADRLPENGSQPDGAGSFRWSDPLPLHESQVDPSLLTRRYRCIAAEAGVKGEVDILLCGVRWEAIH